MMSRSIVVLAFSACFLMANPSWGVCDPNRPGTSYVQIEIEGGPAIKGDLTVRIGNQVPKNATYIGNNTWRTNRFVAPFDYREFVPVVDEIDLEIVEVADLKREREPFDGKCYAIYTFMLERKAWKLHVFSEPPGALLLKHRYLKKDPFPEAGLPLQKGRHGTLVVKGFPGPVDIRIDSRTERGPLHLFTLKKRKANRWWHKAKPAGSLDEISEETIERLAREEREKNPCGKYPDFWSISTKRSTKPSAKSMTMSRLSRSSSTKSISAVSTAEMPWNAN